MFLLFNILFCIVSYFIDMSILFSITQDWHDPKNDHGGIYWYMLFYFHSVFWHAVDVVVILLVSPSMPFHCPGLQYHFLNLSWREDEYSQHWETWSAPNLTGVKCDIVIAIPGMNMGGTLVSYWWVLGSLKAVLDTATTDWWVTGQWRVTATISASTWSTYTWEEDV